jgi:alpha-galactosidase
VRRISATPPGRWNDPDMLEVGNPGTTPTEQASQMAVWSMAAAPLLAGTDLSRASPTTIALLGDPALVAIDQDPAGNPPAASLDGDRLVLRRLLADGTTAVSVTALGDGSVAVPAGVAGRDVLTGSVVRAGTAVTAHATVVVMGRATEP